MNSRKLWEAHILHKEARKKYGNVKATVRGEVLDSKHEAARFRDLLILQAAGEISELQRQKEFACVFNGIYICSWFCDFYYKQKGKWVVEDAKSAATRKDKVYRIKKKIVEALYDVEIKEV